MLDNNADVNATFATLNTTALMTSAFHGHVDVVRLLLERGADCRMVDLQQSTALGYCFGGERRKSNRACQKKAIAALLHAHSEKINDSPFPGKGVSILHKVSVQDRSRSSTVAVVVSSVTHFKTSPFYR